MLSHFSSLTDPRIERRKLHPLQDIIGITLCAVLSGCNDWQAIEVYAKCKQSWLKTFLSLPNGIPSHDTINRVFAILSPQALRDCFLNWIQDVAKITDGRVVSIDGKRLCNSGTDGKKGFIHMVNAWCNANSMVIGQIKTDEKSNEITAIPQLLEMLILKEAIVTIDAMGCQTAIAEKITEHQADYVLAVKDNQAHLLDDIKEAFEQTPDAPSHTTLEKAHGRIEKRTCKVIHDMDWISKKKNWEKLQSIICIETERTLPGKTGMQREQRYYIASLITTPEHFNQIIRCHWGIENRLHWSLDVIFKEDLSTKQVGNAAENFSIITKIALNILKNDTSNKHSLQNKRLKCSLDDNYLQKILFHII